MTEMSFQTLTIDRQPSRAPSKGQMLAKIITIRLLFQLCMSISCLFIPDQNPGDDVLRFDLRLNDPFPSFCLPEHSCSAWMCTDCSSPQKLSASSIPKALWKFFLSPLTKWDAARFLNLASLPSLRDPPITCQQGDIDHCNFGYSEQAHAFFPFFPTLLRAGAFAWIRFVPKHLVPPTFECLLVLMGVFINLICLLLATLSLFSLTSSILPISLEIESRRQVATTACMVYGIWNPAAVFFATNYSESLFSTLILGGHAAFALEKYWLAVPLWMIATYTRSNGTIHSLFLLCHLLAHICHSRTNRMRKTQENQPRSTAIGFFSSLCASVLVFLPVIYHDRDGYARHCHTNALIVPSWCTNKSLLFSLYRFTQQKHWDVGLFHYYKLKQIPNFLLAAPILGISTTGVIYWIRSSLLKYGKGKIPNTAYLLLVGWPLQALSDSVACAAVATEVTSTKPKSPYSYLVDNEKLLGHYAILAGLTVVGLTVAHVQISTRMIISSSPAAIWFLTYCHLQEESPRLRQFVSIYTSLFLFLGVILHVNFLPWT